MQNVTLVSHSLIEHSLTILRDKTTQTSEFRRHSALISKILILEATKTLALTGASIETPLTSFTGKKLAEELVIVPVLRAGLAMLFAVQDFLPSVPVGLMGLERNEATAVAREYYQKLPEISSAHTVIVLDPMLATGGSMDDTITALKKNGATSVVAICIVAAPEGVKRIQTNHPDVPIITSVLDSHLDAQKYIVPGLGDFGDRFFGT